MVSAESYPADLRYHREHDWVRIDGGEAVIGITWKAQDMLGEIVFFQPPQLGAALDKDASYGEVESVKAVSNLVAPVSGKVLDINERVQAEPETVNADPYGEGWLIRVELSDPSEADALLDAEAYKQFLAEE